MFRTVPALLILITSLALSSLATDEKWEPLFNGKDLSGWSVQCIPEDQNKEYWKADN